MLHRIRLAMQTGTFQKLDGAVEVDETFVGGKGHNMHRSVRERKGMGKKGGAVAKTTVLGMSGARDGSGSGGSHASTPRAPR